MAATNKIVIRLAFAGGAAYIFYRYKDRFIGKFNKLKRMNDVNAIIDDVSTTALRAVDGVADGTEDFYDYLVGFLGEEEIDDRINLRFKKEIDDELLGLPTGKAIYLKEQSFQMVLDIRGWNNDDYEIADFSKRGEIPAGNYITFYNVLNIKSKEDFDRVIRMANIMLQYNSPYVIRYDTKKDLGLPKLQDYMSNPPSKYTQFNKIDYKIFEGRPAPNFNIKPVDLFRSLKARIKGENIIKSRHIN